MVIWQDLVVSIANFLFVISLINQVWYGYRRKKALISKATSVPTFIALYGMCIAFFTLSLFLSSAMIFLTATLWLILFIQSLMYKEVEAKK